MIQYQKNLFPASFPNKQFSTSKENELGKQIQPQTTLDLSDTDQNMVPSGVLKMWGKGVGHLFRGARGFKTTLHR